MLAGKSHPHVGLDVLCCAMMCYAMLSPTSTFVAAAGPRRQGERGVPQAGGSAARRVDLSSYGRGVLLGTWSTSPNTAGAARRAPARRRIDGRARDPNPPPPPPPPPAAAATAAAASSSCRREPFLIPSSSSSSCCCCCSCRRRRREHASLASQAEHAASIVGDRP